MRLNGEQREGYHRGDSERTVLREGEIEAVKFDLDDAKDCGTATTTGERASTSLNVL